MSKRSIFEEVGDTAASAPTPGAAAAGKSGARRAVRVWLWVLLALVTAMIAVGGLTRLTDSGLSITEWNVVVGAVPPLSESDWIAAFESYKTTDEYRLQNNWMSLADFKPIFWWEWSHRFLGRFIGLVWLLPLIFFAATKRIPRGWGGRLTLIGLLGGAQGAIGWWMVYSGLSIRTDVAPYRLATHLGVAVLIFGLICWYLMALRREEWALLQARRRRSARACAWADALTGLIFVQMLLGGLLAGADGGAGWNTWPLMDGAAIASSAFELTPLWSNFFENPAMTQFIHRTFAYLVIAAAVAFALAVRRGGHKATGVWSLWLLAGVAAQAAMGIATLLAAAPVELAIIHQLGALALLALALRARFEAAYPSEQKISA